MKWTRCCKSVSFPDMAYRSAKRKRDSKSFRWRKRYCPVFAKRSTVHFCLISHDLLVDLRADMFIAPAAQQAFIIDASLPAKPIYKKRGYRETEYHTIRTRKGDFLCYDVMEMKQSEANPCIVEVQGSQG